MTRSQTICLILNDDHTRTQTVAQLLITRQRYKCCASSVGGKWSVPLRRIQEWFGGYRECSNQRETECACVSVSVHVANLPKMLTASRWIGHRKSSNSAAWAWFYIRDKLICIYLSLSSPSLFLSLSHYWLYWFLLTGSLKKCYFLWRVFSAWKKFDICPWCLSLFVQNVQCAWVRERERLYMFVCSSLCIAFAFVLLVYCKCIAYIHMLYFSMDKSCTSIFVNVRLEQLDCVYVYGCKHLHTNTYV